MTEQPPVKKRSKAKETAPKVLSERRPDIATFKVKSPRPGVDEPYTFEMGGISVTDMNLKAGIKKLLVQGGIDQSFFVFLWLKHLSSLR